MDFKYQKELEKRINESLYTNLKLLSTVYPTNKDLNSVLKKDMFVKSNKTAFFEVIHYLLNILNPEVTKQKLTSWPPYDVQKERKFRSEVISYINELNTTNPDADIPICQASSLISPGGFKFAQFIFKVSRFVLDEHLKRENVLPLPKSFKKSGNVSMQILHLKKEANLINTETNETIRNFETNYGEMTKTSEDISTKLIEINKDNMNQKQLLEKKEIWFKSKHPSYPSVTSLQEKLSSVTDKFNNILELKNIFVSCSELLMHLQGSDLIMEHEKDGFTVPPEISHVITNKEELNLLEFFEGLIVILEKKALELTGPSISFINQSLETLNTLILKYQSLLNQLEYQKETVSRIPETMSTLLNKVKNLDADDSVLATPYALKEITT